MPIQRTFTIIPELGAGNRTTSPAPAARPMTSKQVQKAHKAATRAPRISRAEARRQEKLEQERIRKEFEKEKAAAKARALREKKKEKEAKEREVKKKKGLPTVSVRPSQDTIAWFVRGNGAGRKRDSGGRTLLVVEEEAEPEEETLPSKPSPRKSSMIEPPHGDKETSENDTSKKRKVGSQEVHATARGVPEQETPQQQKSRDKSQQDTPQQEALMQEAPQQEEPPQEKPQQGRSQQGRSQQGRSQQEISQQETPAHDAPIAWTMDLNDVEDVFYEDIEAQLTKAPTTRIDENKNIEMGPAADGNKSITRPTPQEAETDEFPESLEDEFDFDMIINGDDEDEDTNDAPTLAKATIAPPNPDAQTAAIDDLVEDFSDDIEFDIMEATAISASAEINMANPIKPLMPPPPLPKSQEPHDDFGDEIEMEMLDGLMDKATKQPAKDRYEEDLGLRRPTNTIRSRPSPPWQDPPMSTQAILYNLDDFFPSPSQQARELDEEPFTQPSPILPQRPSPQKQHTPSPHPEKPSQDQDLAASSSPAPPPRRFFTSSGSHELMALAIQRSRRTAALEAIHQRERARIEAGMVAQAEAQDKARVERLKARNRPKTPAKPSIPPKTTRQKFRDQTPITAKTATNTTKTLNTTKTPNTNPPLPPAKSIPTRTPTNRPEHNKENQVPTTTTSSPNLNASQETEYGGDWVDDMALELMI